MVKVPTGSAWPAQDHLRHEESVIGLDPPREGLRSIGLLPEDLKWNRQSADTTKTRWRIAIAFAPRSSVLASFRYERCAYGTDMGAPRRLARLRWAHQDEFFFRIMPGMASGRMRGRGGLRLLPRSAATFGKGGSGREADRRLKLARRADLGVNQAKAVACVNACTRFRLYLGVSASDTSTACQSHAETSHKAARPNLSRRRGTTKSTNARSFSGNRFCWW